MSLKQRFLYKSAIGFSLGVLLTIVIYFGVIFFGQEPLGGYEIESFLKRLLIGMLSGGLMGIIGNGGSVIYEVENWSIFRTTVTHFAMAFSAFLIIGFLNNWLSPKDVLFNIFMITIWIAVYFMIWLMQYLIFKKEVKEINRGLQMMKQSKEIN